MSLLLLCTVLVHVIALNEVAGNVVLKSTVEENRRQFACEGELVTFTCQVFRSIFLQWNSQLIRQTPIVFVTGFTASVSFVRPPFITTLTSIAGSGINTNFTSTLQVNASRTFRRNDSTVQCKNLQGIAEKSKFTVSDEPAAPLNVTVNQVERVSGGGSVTVTTSWIRPPNYELFDIDRYDINVSSTSGVQHMITACGECTNTSVTVSENPSNVRPSTTFTITISARNKCAESGPVANASYTLFAGDVVLTSTMEESGRQFSCEGELVTFTCQVFKSIFLKWKSPLIRQTPIVFVSGFTVPVSTSRPPFIASLTSIAGIGLSTNFTSTLQVNASRTFARNHTTVECRNQRHVTEELKFTVTDEPAAPLNVTVNQVERVSGGGSVTITASWIQPPNFELFDIDRYDINVSSTSGVQHTTTACGECTNTTVTVTENPSNVGLSTTFTITISARNKCGENGPIATAFYTLATITLTSSVVGQACPGEVVTYTCMVEQGATVGWTAAPVLTDPTAVLFLATCPTDQRIRDCSAVSSIWCADLDFHATFKNVSDVQNGFANLISTFRFNATARLNETVVQCSTATVRGAPTASQSLIVAGYTSPPLTLSYTVQQYGRDSVILTVQWQPPQYDGGAPVNYTITVSPGLSPVTTSGTSVPVTVPYNVIHTVSIVATNCNGSSSAAIVTIPAIVVDCSTLTNPANGQVSHTGGTTFGETATYSCNSGYNLVGDSTRTCLATRVWSGSIPTCQPVNCGTLTNPANGQVSHTGGATFGRITTYSCNTGYNLMGSRTRTCQATGVWSGSAPTCQPVNCGALTNPASGRVSHTAGTTFGMTSTYSCNTGYNLMGDSIRTCQVIGLWSGSAPTCTAVDCGTLTNPANGHINHTTGTTFGQTATYNCNKGYNLVGGRTRTCHATGVWSGSAPTCQSVDCATLTNPANGHVNHTTGTTFGQTATYSCNTGYNLVGDRTRTCQATGVWSGSAPTCQDDLVDTPTNVVVVNSTTTTLTVQWNVPLRPAGIVAVRYRINYKSDGDRFTRVHNMFPPSQELNASTLNTTISFLQSNTEYMIQVRMEVCYSACFSYLPGNYSELILASTNAIRPSAPRNVTVRLIAPLLVEIRWRQPAVSNGQIIHYTVYAIPIVVPAITKRQAASNLPNGTIKQHFPGNATAGNVMLTNHSVTYQFQMTASTFLGRVENEGNLSTITPQSTIIVPEAVPTPPPFHVNDTITGDPLLTVPLNVGNDTRMLLGLNEGEHVSLCYELHGEADENFNLVSDVCVSVNAHYARVRSDVDINVMNRIGIRAVDSTNQCQNIRVDVYSCRAFVDGVEIAMSYRMGGIFVRKYSTRVRIAVPNCEDNDLVMWVFCQTGSFENGNMTFDAPMIRFVIARGFNLAETSHGILGQFWNIPINVVRYSQPIDGVVRSDTYSITVNYPGQQRQLVGFLYPLNWEFEENQCLYVGSGQGGPIEDVDDPNDPVIYGEYSDYKVDSIFGTEFDYDHFQSSRCSQLPTPYVNPID